LPDNHGVVHLHEQSRSDLHDGALGVAKRGDQLGNRVTSNTVDSSLEPIEELNLDRSARFCRSLGVGSTLQYACQRPVPGTDHKPRLKDFLGT
jgi:hypothetical protein